ncbi:MAG: glucoamylase family protein, partial [Saprospiraceae bacterium]
GDIVETSYLVAGLLTAKEFFNGQSTGEINLRKIITEIWETVEWDWHIKSPDSVLYWHWSPKYNWEMNHELRGWNEALITYILAAASPTHPITKAIYDKGWARNGAMKNGKSFYGINLPLGPDFGGPLFFSHYSFLGIDPRNLKDSYADYWTQEVNHTKINYEYCKANPKKFYGYSASCWGLTASDTRTGYDAHSPTNDHGVITPTAALSSLPYTPDASMAALRYFYYTLGDKLFKEYGLVDAFNLSENWFASSFLAIDQGPIIIMIEDYRSGMIWDYTMKNTDIRAGLTKLGFSY